MGPTDTKIHTKELKSIDELRQSYRKRAKMESLVCERVKHISKSQPREQKGIFALTNGPMGERRQPSTGSNFWALRLDRGGFHKPVGDGGFCGVVLGEAAYFT